MRSLSLLSTTVVFLFSLTALAAERCYQVSSDKELWSKTPESICIDETFETEKVKVSLKSGLSFQETLIAEFHFNLLERAKCIDCNADIYGVSNPENSTFNALSIHFNGVRNLETGKESGTIQFGQTKLYYRSY